MNKLIVLSSGKIVNLDAVAFVDIRQGSGLELYFSGDRELSLNGDESTSFLAKIQEETGQDMTDAFMAIWGGQEQLAEWQKKRVQRKIETKDS